MILANHSHSDNNSIVDSTMLEKRTQKNVPVHSGHLRTLHGKFSLHWIVGILALAFALFPLAQVQAAATHPTFTEFSAPSRDFIGPVQFITAGSDGALWLTADSNVIVRISTQGAVTTTTLPSFQFNAQVITAGPDKALWFTLPNSVPGDTTARIGRLTTKGAFTSFKIPFSSLPFGITSGSDGNLYFTDQLKASIDRITPQGKITRFFFKDPNGGIPGTITTGPDGNLWFTDPNSDRIGKMTPSGQFTFFTIPNAQRGSGGGFLDAITAGPDGNVWFTIDGFSGNNALPRVGRITPAGTVTEFSLPSENDTTLLSGIATGSDGNLWFTDTVSLVGHPQVGSIVRITPTGVMTQFFTPSQPSLDLGIAAGPDGNLWFAEIVGLNNLIGRITTH